MVSIRNPVAHGAAPDGLTIAALGLMDNLGLRIPDQVGDDGKETALLGRSRLGDVLHAVGDRDFVVVPELADGVLDGAFSGWLDGHAVGD